MIGADPLEQVTEEFAIVPTPPIKARACFRSRGTGILISADTFPSSDANPRAKWSGPENQHPWRPVEPSRGRA